MNGVQLTGSGAGFVAQSRFSTRHLAASSALHLSLGAGFVCGLALSVSEYQSLGGLWYKVLVSSVTNYICIIHHRCPCQRVPLFLMVL